MLLEKVFSLIHSFRTKQQLSLGIDIGEQAVTAVGLIRCPKTVKLTALSRVDFPNKAAVNQDVVIGSSLESVLLTLKQQLKFTFNNIAIAITCSQVICKVIQVERTLTESEIEYYLYGNLKLVSAQMVGEVNIDFVILGNNKIDETLIDVFVVVAKQSLINERLSSLKRVGLNCTAVDIESHALIRSINLHSMLTDGSPASGVIANIHINQSTSLLLVMENGQLLFSREIKLGYRQLIKMAPVNGEKIQTSTISLDNELTNSYLLQLTKSIQSYQAIHDEKVIQQWLSSGAGTQFPELLRIMEKELSISIIVNQPLELLPDINQSISQCKHDMTPKQGSFHLALGLAAKGLL